MKRSCFICTKSSAGDFSSFHVGDQISGVLIGTRIKQPRTIGAECEGTPPYEHDLPLRGMLWEWRELKEV